MRRAHASIRHATIRRAAVAVAIGATALSGAQLAAPLTAEAALGSRAQAARPEQVAPAAQAAQAAAANGTVSIRLDQKLADLTFNVPGSAAQLAKAIRLINGAPAASTIRMSIYSIDRAEVRDAILRAHNRGVKVYIVHSGDKRSTSGTTLNTQQKMAKQLNDRLGGRFRFCDHGSAFTGDQDRDKNGCISTATSGLMHAKYMLFSKTKGEAGTYRTNVVWFGSGNFTSHSGVNMYNNAVTVYGDSTLYNGFITDVWSPMWNESSYSNNDYYYVGGNRGYFGSTASNSQVYVSPEQTTDLVKNRLDYVNANSDCRIRVMHNGINDTRLAVVDKLVSLKHGGCKVWVVANSVGTAAKAKFKSAGIPVHGPKAVHDKAIIIKSRFDGSAGLRTIVLTGSHNLSKSALRYNDELLVKLTDNATMYDAFVGHFNHAYNSSTTMPGTSS